MRGLAFKFQYDIGALTCIVPGQVSIGIVVILSEVEGPLLTCVTYTAFARSLDSARDDIAYLPFQQEMQYRKICVGIGVAINALSPQPNIT
jgi:hypothetical protein